MKFGWFHISRAIGGWHIFFRKSIWYIGWASHLYTADTTSTEEE